MDDGKTKSDSNEGEARSKERFGEKVDGQGEENEDQNENKELEESSDDNWFQTVDNSCLNNLLSNFDRWI